MPCTDEGRYSSEDLQPKIDKLTRMLCEVLSTRDKAKTLSDMKITPTTQDWWNKHQKWDAERKLRERQAKCKHVWVTHIHAEESRRYCSLCGLKQKARYE